MKYENGERKINRTSAKIIAETQSGGVAIIKSEMKIGKRRKLA